jgi:hypothetical protein
MTDPGHWVKIMAAICKKGAEIVDMERGETLAREAGFTIGKGPS